MDTGWTIEYVRDLQENEFIIHSILAQKRLGIQTNINMAMLKKPTL